MAVGVYVRLLALILADQEEENGEWWYSSGFLLAPLHRVVL